ncbi:MAG: sorbosone dehydrogenase family protein [Croceitalea sp.]|nr:PQQ-dependent sugar dehydrogenase [Croceitalea sp.]MBT8238477.1 PQQ-dependent sugar dehydrogenase [Croceitalea sp.]NNC35607.1 sorbosone dehydrogenase family protein [Croceitalea sp.]NNL09831.1 sorbosone dehydrogenase family protein [Croceitalea sp.]NNM17436.1 sorbosone dehydrogenase family protein [Croceitalea sp.]
MKRSHSPIYLIALITIISIVSCKQKKEKDKDPSSITIEMAYDTNLPIQRLQLPDGFKIDVYAEGVDGARSMAMGDNGTLFVGTRNDKTVYAIQDTNRDYRADNIMILDSTMEVPNGIAFREGALYVAEVGRLLRYDNIEAQLDNLPTPEIVYDDYPTEFHHGWKYIAFGPDGKLYVPVGAPCNICDASDQDERFATITRMDPDGSNREIYAKGVRNSVGFTWHPDTKELWFTDNGRDMMGDDVPPCELNRVTEAGQHFGYPFCHGGTVKDPEFGDQRPCSDFVPPVQSLGAHVAPLAIKFNTGNMFPASYNGHAFIAEHGSWNRSSKVGYRITLVKLEDGKAVSYEPFIDGWLDEENQEAFGRPVDMLFLNDGSMLISDDYGDAIYRVTYDDSRLASN